VTDDFKRLVAGDRRAHHLLDILGIAYFQGIHTIRLAVLARPSLEKARLAAAIHPFPPSKDVNAAHKAAGDEHCAFSGRTSRDSTRWPSGKG
jgi:hypothetical protein